MTDTDSAATRLNEAGVHTVEVATPDVHAHMRGKRVPIRRFVESVAGGAIGMADAIYVLDYENDLVDSPYINMGTGFLDCALVPDLSTLRVFGHRPGYALVMADTLNQHGDPHPLGPRSVLRRQVEAAATAGYEVLAATELEAYLVTPEGEPVVSHIQYSSLTVDSDLEVVLCAIREALAAAGIEVEGTNFEYGPGQVEINTGPSDPITCADNTMLFKSIVRQVAADHGLRATFMPKPWADQSGNGLHTHTSLRGADGSNAFASSHDGPNELMAQWLGGIMHHAGDMAMLGSVTPNGYKRIREYTFAPTHVTWGLDNRTVMARCICEAGSGANRVEYRSGGADANPYVVLAAIIAAGLDGLANSYPLPPMGVGDVYEDPGDAVPLTTDMAEAVEGFRNSDMAGFLGADFSVNYALAAEFELTKYNASAGATDDDEVTDWERQRYLWLA
ncbi:MAG: glutamine synthetase family protein [Actinomycetota bacterium]|jgi:glutamine synthetase|nr:glutamine synthetase family protein [Actinomycetota bacterium]